MSDIDNIYKNMVLFFLGYLCAVAILGTLTPGFLFEPLGLRPIETKHDLLFYSFIIGMCAFSMWQMGYYVSEVILLIYRKLTNKEEKEQ